MLWMKRKRWPWFGLAGLSASVLTLALLSSCGDGGIGTNGTGSPVLVSQVGTVSGLGSVIVDGVRWDDSAVATEQTVSGTDAQAALAQLGQRVALTLGTDSAGAAVLSRVEVLPSAVGPVSERTADTLAVLGQTVVVNADASAGPVTVFGGGLKGLVDVALGDWVEVHAIWIEGNAPVGTQPVGRLMATRIERRSVPAGTPTTSASTVRVGGPASAVSTSADGSQQFAIGALQVKTSAQTQWVVNGAVGGVTAAGSNGASAASVQAGQTVQVFAPASAWDASARMLTAQVVKVMATSSTTAGTVSSGRWRHAGIVSNWTGTSFTLDGRSMVIDAPLRTSVQDEVDDHGRVDQPVLRSEVSLKDGLYVQVTAEWGTDGRWHVSRIERTGHETRAELHGTVLNWSVAQQTLRVRDTVVSVSAQTVFDLKACGAAILNDGLYISVQGQATAQGLQATSISCEQEPLGKVSPLTRQGSVVSFNLEARQFTLQRSAQSPSITVSWDAKTVLPLGTSWTDVAGLIGSSRGLEVEGLLSADGAQLQARAIRWAATGPD